MKKEVRTQLKESKAELYSKISTVLSVLSNWARGECNTATRARVADFAFAGAFKANRQRRVDKRVAVNAVKQKEDSKRFDELLIDRPALLKASEESKTEYSCILTLQDWAEIASQKDVFGFGLAVTRPECVVDDPSQIRIQKN